MIEILLLQPLNADMVSVLVRDFIVHDYLEPQPRELYLQEHGASIDVVLTNGSRGIDAGTIDALPKLKLISCMGAGFENVDRDAARARDIVVTHGPGTNTESVADHVFALMFALARRVIDMDAAVRNGEWSKPEYNWPTLTEKRIGILGLGRIGEAIATRAQGFRAEIGYHNRNQRSDLPYQYFSNLTDLATWADYLIVACPGGKETYHAVNADILSALGADGYLVNVGRGTVVDSNAVIDALEKGVIAGAALDVVEGEPEIPEVLLGAPKLVFTPHIAGRSPESSVAKIDLFRQNVKAHFDGRAALTPVPEA